MNRLVWLVLLLALGSSSAHAGKLDFLHRSKSASAPLIASVAPPGDGKGEVADIANPEQGLLLQRRGYGIVVAPSLDAYLNGALGRLQKTWPATPKPAHVYVTPDPSFVAYSTEDGAIFVSNSMLDSVQSEDELAAVLAHEYAHILLDHYSTNVLSRFSARLYGVGNLFLRYRLSKNGQSDLIMRQFAANEVGLQLMQSGLRPALSRKQETAADELGTDLLIRAGYNPLAMHQFLDRMVGWEQHDAEANKLSKERYKQIIAFEQHDGQINFSLQPLGEDLMGSAQDLYARLSKSHPRADQRRDEERTYLKKFYADVPRPEEQPLPWLGATPNNAMAEVFRGIARIRQAQAALAQKDGHEAASLIAAISTQGPGHSGYADFARLSIALINGHQRDVLQSAATPWQGPGSLFQTHYMYLETVEQMEPNQAVAALEKSRVSLSDPPELLPFSIRIYRHAGDPNRSAMYYLKCMSGGDRQLMEQCEQANKG